MFDIHKFFYKNIVSFSCFILVLGLSIFFIRNCFSYIQTIDEADKGIITEKRYVPSSTFLFKHVDTHYRIYITVYYEGAIGMRETEKYFIVEKEVYDQYKVGDFFDSTLI